MTRAVHATEEQGEGQQRRRHASEDADGREFERGQAIATPAFADCDKQPRHPRPEEPTQDGHDGAGRFRSDELAEQPAHLFLMTPDRQDQHGASIEDPRDPRRPVGGVAREMRGGYQEEAHQETRGRPRPSSDHQAGQQKIGDREAGPVPRGPEPVESLRE